MGSDGARAGAYLGGAPQGGFGRRGGGVAAPRPAQPRAEPQGLSPLARQVVEDHRAAQTAPPEIDFVIGGHDIQYVEIELDPGEAVVAENGAMIWKDQDVDFDLVLGDGRNDSAGIGKRLLSAGTNLISGESLYLSQFRHGGYGGKARVALGGKTPGSIVAIRLSATDRLICHRGSFLAGAKGVAVSAALQNDLVCGLFGEEGLVTQTLTGEGWAFLHVGGALIERELAAGQAIQVDSGCVVAHQDGVRQSVGFAGGVSTVIGGGEGLLFATLVGPGKVWIQTLPFQRIADAIATAGLPSASASIGSGIASGIGAGLGAGVKAGIGYGVAQVAKEGGIDMLKKIF